MIFTDFQECEYCKEEFEFHDIIDDKFIVFGTYDMWEEKCIDYTKVSYSWPNNGLCEDCFNLSRRK